MLSGRPANPGREQGENPRPPAYRPYRPLYPKRNQTGPTYRRDRKSAPWAEACDPSAAAEKERDQFDQMHRQYMRQFEQSEAPPAGAAPYAQTPPATPRADAPARPCGPVAHETADMYIPGFLRKHIGREIRLSFTLDGAVEKSGRLISVGENYLVLQPSDDSISVVCDLFAVKLIHIMELGAPV